MLTDESLGSNFILYRLPQAKKAHVIICDEDNITISYDMKEIGKQEGYVFAPFHISKEKPLLIFDTECKKELLLDEIKVEDNDKFAMFEVNEQGKKDYFHVFDDFHRAIVEGKCNKIVLSRKYHISDETVVSAVELFKTACNLCPDMYVSLVSSPLCGIWLTATPEYLLNEFNGVFHTAALAGTRPNINTDKLGNNDKNCDISVWNDKDVKEQDYVSQYIRDRVGCCASEMTEEGPKTIIAGNVSHILTDFNYRLKEGITLGMLLENLHPTPAVCGIPKDYTYNKILEDEGYDREYYSGFQGVVSSSEGVHLFVTLRCMKVSDSGYDLFAGGGLVFKSDVENEWAETEAKMEIMKRCIARKKI